MPSSWFRSLPSAAITAGACVSLVLAPQAGYLAGRIGVVSPARLLAVNLLYALLLALLWLAVRSSLRPRLGLQGQPPTASQVLVAAPLALLWWPAVVGAPTSTARTWVPVAVGIATLLELTLVWNRRPQWSSPE